MKQISEREAYENLANAIVMSAVRDYKAALMCRKRQPDSKIGKKIILRMEAFFRSGWFSTLTPLDPEYLIRRTKELVDQQYKEKVGETKEENV